MKKRSFLGSLLVLGGAVAAAVYSNKQSRDLLTSEFEKAKQDPKAYAENLKETVNTKSQEVQKLAQEEINKAKEDPKTYRENVTKVAQEKSAQYRQKAQEKSNQVKEQANSKVEEIKKKKDNSAPSDAELEANEMDAEGGASNIHVVTNENIDNVKAEDDTVVVEVNKDNK